ncbi:MAG: TetR/AcrR family transcriptional regulator [Spirochaetia bacterium]
MARAFTETEKERIGAALIRAVSESISEKGLKKTSIDHLVKAARISKGAFYLFYDSKEMLVLDAIRSVQDVARARLLKILEPPKKNPREVMAKFVAGLFDVFEEFPFMKEMAQADVMMDLLRSLPEEAIENEFESDEHFFESFHKKLLEGKIIHNVDKKVIGGLPRMILALIMNRQMIGGDRFNKLKALLIAGISKELTRT